MLNHAACILAAFYIHLCVADPSPDASCLIQTAASPEGSSGRFSLDTLFMCAELPTSEGSTQERCERANTLNDGYRYTFNANRGTPRAACGSGSPCLCCRRASRILSTSNDHIQAAVEARSNHPDLPDVDDVLPVIPIHQTAKDKGGALLKWGQFMRTWNVDGFENRFYNNTDLENVVREVVPHLFEKWSKFAHVIERVDFFRFAVLYRDGGVYADMDQELLNANLLRRLASSGRLILPTEKDSLIGQSLMMSPPHHPFWLALMEHIAQKYNETCYEVDNTGPDAITAFWKATGGCQEWGPQKVSLVRNLMVRTDGAGTRAIGSPSLSQLIALNKHSVTLHHETGTWRGPRSLEVKKTRAHKNYPCAVGSIVLAAEQCVLDLDDCPQRYEAVSPAFPAADDDAKLWCADPLGATKMFAERKANETLRARSMPRSGVAPVHIVPYWIGAILLLFGCVATVDNSLLVNVIATVA